MSSQYYPARERRELRVRITKSLYERLVAECGECGCTMNSVVTLAIAREISKRRAERTRDADGMVLSGQIDIEGSTNA